MSNNSQTDQNKPANPFIEMEKKWLKHWYETGIIDKYLHKNDDAEERFSFQDGPITANNPMGVHHGWGRTYKDLWQKFHNLLGHKQRFQNGFDCQGLWVEVEVEKELGLKTKKEIENLVPGDRKASIAKFVQLCKDRVTTFSTIQTDQSKRLGYFMDWDHSYFTMSPENNYMIWYFLKKCYENGWIYKGHESVPWCPRCETAISQHEMLTEDYKEVTHESIYMKFPIVNRDNEYLLVWTTTPWTIPANIAVAVDEKLDYSLVEVNGKKYWVLKALVQQVFEKDEAHTIKTVTGKELVGLKYSGAFDDLPAVSKVAEDNQKLFHTVIPTDENIMPISSTEGTGLVHTAVSAGTEDFLLGKKLGLPMIPVIADNAEYLPNLDFLSGNNAKKHPRIILDYMEEKGYAFKIFNYTHRYPACWRCKTELVWKVADEWYISMDKGTNDDRRTLRERMMEVAKKIHWLPEFGLDRELDWLKNMHDWLISKKNRYWGLALPIFECEKCSTFEVIGSKEELKERAVKGWEQFEGQTPHKPYIDEIIITCKSCNQEVKRIDDVGNPWLDAGIVPYSTITAHNEGDPLYKINRNEWKKWFPINFITESFPGQFKNWFYAMIAMSTVLEDTNPFQTVLGFGTLLGEDGRAMHKSWGNSIAFHEGADIIGVDVMRWMYTRQNPADNMLFGYKKADEVRRQFYLILWNVYKYFQEYSQLDKVSINTEEFKTKTLTNVLDTWIIARFIQLEKIIRENLEKYNAKEAALATEEFVDDLSTWYIRRSRNRVGFHSDDNRDKEDFFNTLHFVLTKLTIILSPFLPFITEEIFTNLTKNESVHLTHWPKLDETFDQLVITDMKLVREIVEVGHRVRKELKLKLRQPLASATVTLAKGSKFRSDNKEQCIHLLEGELNVKKIEINEGTQELIEVMYDTKLTPELQLEGELRDLIRTIQSERKNKGVTLHEKVKVVVPEKFKEFSEYIKKNVQAESIMFGETVEVQ